MSVAHPSVLPAAPAIPGLWFRTYRDESDLPAIVELLPVADGFNGETMVTSIDRERRHYRDMTRLPAARLHRRIILVRMA